MRSAPKYAFSLAMVGAGWHQIFVSDGQMRELISLQESDG